ncbi:MAG: cytochrome-c peroxidase [Nitrospirae bacterium]|nr:MAG: cytochrome-c peroxidase [Nitrospirota bacterium]
MGVGPAVKKILQTYGNNVRLVIKNLPYKYRDFSFIAAEASLAARDQGKFWEMHWLLHEHSPRLDRESLIKYAEQLKLDLKRFKRDLDKMAHLNEIKRDLALAKKLDLYNTPAFFINGIKLLGNRPFESFKQVIDAELEKKGQRKTRLEPLPPPPPAPKDPIEREKIELGKKLFFDRRLSGDGTMSCATCHNPETGFTDALAISLSYPTTRHWRNTPTIINVRYGKHFFWDGRAATLEEQALFPIMSAFEMNQNLDFLEEELKEIPAYRDAFSRVFGGEITRERVVSAISAFERTIVSYDSPLDRYLKGDRNALTSEELMGLKLFEGKARCILCHNGPNLTDEMFYNIGVPENPSVQDDPRVAATRRFVAKVSGFENFERITEDPGRYIVTKDEKDWKAFKTPSLREIALTAPYMHNGVFKTLDEVIEFFNRGGGDSKNKTRLIRPLNLTGEEKRALKAFLERSLSGKITKIKIPEVP